MTTAKICAMCEERPIVYLSIKVADPGSKYDIIHLTTEGDYCYGCALKRLMQIQNILGRILSTAEKSKHIEQLE